ncbi:hypothetical protein AWB78_02417 [Caballeronia calidae]|uniref:Gluconolactonase n=1 Tax=Caballeronia calidae TaxID=1777139 RepID=A0A158B913_9BURK|nr:hypothetical protein [Caballeronia calidae]SAK66529.1 hypothetical protein AWB78_02417 [Caballeronia calidae]
MIACFVGSSTLDASQAKRRSSKGTLRSVILPAAVALSALMLSQASNAQALFIGDNGDSSVKQYDVSSGNYAGAFVPSKAHGLNGPMGMIFTNGQFLVVSQNPAPEGSTGTTGEVLRFDGTTGTYINKLVSSGDRNAPFAPRGIVRGGPGNQYYVADTVSDSKCANGNVKRYNDNGAYLGNLDLQGFPDPDNVFHPRGLVFGPDGYLYVSSTGCLDSKLGAFDPLKGYILRFNANTGKFMNVVASDQTVASLHRPEGLVFDSAGNLWVTSFQADRTDADRILKLDGNTGKLLDELVLAPPNSINRSYAQAIIFGPGGKLYIPIAGNDAKTTGEVRRCDTATKKCDVIVPSAKAGGAVGQAWYLIFKNSDPATLNYRN